MAKVNKITLIILGPQGSGKGTQARIIAKKLRLDRFEMGAQLRKVMKKNDEFGKQVAVIVNAGDYVPDWIIKRVLENFFDRGQYQRIIFDGVPRTFDQSKIFDELLARHQLPSARAISIKLAKSTSLKRLIARGRRDDTKKIIENRLKNHYELTGPVIEHYRGLGRLIEIDGEPAVEQVAKSIFAALKAKGSI